ncbi:MAG TPA: alpha/beta hydrolase [Candidatus Saccharimonadales bacterium]|nr:alpha/beta hydrolase [Candidatus Saccharimonadales bacterium]
MPDKSIKTAADFISPLTINGLNGRVMRLPAPKGKKRDILLAYGQHSSLERWWGLAQALNQYGAMTVPDLPGFGGMDSLYKIGKPATIDNLADYLKDFIDANYKKRKVTLVGMSLGFPIATRMLQKYPEMIGRVDMLISVVGFCHYDDFVFPKRQQRFYKYASRFLSLRWTSAFYQHVFAAPWFIRRAYKHSRVAKEKFEGKDDAELKETIEAETILWKINDIRTQMRTNHEMFTLDNTDQHIDLPVWHVAVDKDRYFDNRSVAKHMRQTFSSFEMFTSHVESHAPSIIADMESAAAYLPDKLTKIINKN